MLEKLTKLVLFCFLGGLGLASCGPRIFLEHPIPKGKKLLTDFPKKYHGEFFNEEDSLYISIQKQNAYYYGISDLASPLNEVLSDSNYRLENKRLYGPLLKAEGTVVSVRNDSIFGEIHSLLDSVNLSANNKERQVYLYKRRLFFNRFNHDYKLWEAYTINTKGRNALQLNSFSKVRDLKLLTKISKLKEIPSDEQNSDTGVKRYSVSLTKRQLKRFLRKKGFSKSQNFIRVSTK